MVQRLLKVQASLEQMVVSNEWKQHAAECSYKEDCEEARKVVLNGNWWSKVQQLLELTEKIVQLLRLADSDKPCTGKIYWNCFLIQEHIKSFKGLPPSSLQPLERAVAARWVDLHSPLHSVAYMLDPEYWDHDQGSLPDVVQDWYDVLEKLYPRDVETQAKIIEQLEDYRSKMGAFGREVVQEMAKTMPAHKWWSSHGGTTPELQKLAVRVLAQVCSASSCERNWSAFDFIHTKKRNRLAPQQANDLVYVFSNLRLLDKLQNPLYKEDNIAWREGVDEGEED